MRKEKGPLWRFLSSVQGSEDSSMASRSAALLGSPLSVSPKENARLPQKAARSCAAVVT